MPVPNKLPYRYMKSGESVVLTAGSPEEAYSMRIKLAGTKYQYKKDYGIDLDVREGEKPGEILVTVVNNPKPLAKPSARGPKATKAEPSTSVSRIERSARSVYRDVFVGCLSFGMSPTDAQDRAIGAMVSYRNTLEAWRIEDEKRVAQ